MTRPRALRTQNVAAGLVLAALCGGLGACGGAKAAPRSVSTPAGATSTAAIPAPPRRSHASRRGDTARCRGLLRARAPAAQLAAKAGAICSAATAQGRRLAVPSNLTSNPHAAAAYFDKVVPPLDAETRAFQALTPTADAAAQWEAFLGAQVALDRVAQGYRQSAHAGRQTSLTEIRQLVTVGQAIADAAVRIGARCT